MMEKRAEESNEERLQELAQRGIFATPQYIGRLLSSQSGAVKIGSRWYVFD